MQKLILAILLVHSSCLFAQDIKQVNYNQLEKILNKNDNITYVVNFWATWCKPCVVELPYFEEIHRDYKDQNVKVLLVSLDFVEKIQDQLIPFIEKNKIKSEVVVLSAPNENEWIPKVNEKWSGALPATLIIQGEKRKFYEQSFTRESLKKAIIQFL